MATRTSQVWWGAIKDLRIHPVQKWVRATSWAGTVVDTRAAVLVWEPRRVVPSYAVPVVDIAAELVPTIGTAADERPVSVGEMARVLDPSSPFSAHTTPGTSVTIRTAAGDLEAAGFLPDDADLAGYAILDWDAFDSWFEEDERVVAHPHDPFQRIDCLASSRQVRIGYEGVTLAESRRATLLYETNLPTRFYLPADDVAMDLLEPSVTVTACAYKGQATYWSARIGGTVLPDIAWTYREPLHDALPVAGRIAFLTERLDLTLDGVEQPRPRTPWS